MRKANEGITLIELMVVMVVVAILAAIAYPSYREYVVRSKRSEAKVALQQAAQGLENCFTRFNQYNNAGCDLADTLDDDGITTPDGNYLVELGSVSDMQFTLTATPQGAQAGDTDCGTFSLTENNVRAVTGSKGIAECWK